MQLNTSQLSTNSPKPAFECPYCENTRFSTYFAAKQGTILQCRECRGLFTQDRRNEFELPPSLESKILVEGYEKLIRDTASANLKIAENIVDLALQYVPEAKNFLELGCGSASIGTCIKSRIPGATYTGIEGSKQFYDSVEPTLKPSIIFEMNLHRALEQIQDQSQDVAILNHVLEHLEEPKKILSLLKRKLRKGGVLYVEVPNEQWKNHQMKVRSFLKRDQLLWFPGHINFFTKATLKRSLTTCGLEPEFIEKGEAAKNLPVVIKMLGGENAFRQNKVAKVAYQFLKISRIERLLGYGILLRCIARA